MQSVALEITNEWPPRVGTLYQNRGKNGPWNIYKVSKFTQNAEFELVNLNSTYHVNYQYYSRPNHATQLVYHEWVAHGEIEEPFKQADLNRLKAVLESAAK